MELCRENLRFLGDKNSANKNVVSKATVPVPDPFQGLYNAHFIYLCGRNLPIIWMRTYYTLGTYHLSNSKAFFQ